MPLPHAELFHEDVAVRSIAPMNPLNWEKLELRPAVHLIGLVLRLVHLLGSRRSSTLRLA